MTSEELARELRYLDMDELASLVARAASAGVNCDCAVALKQVQDKLDKVAWEEAMGEDM